MRLLDINHNQQLKPLWVINMEHLRLYQLKVEELEKENKDLKQQLEKQELIKKGYKEEISKWNKKYKDLKNQIKNG